MDIIKSLKILELDRTASMEDVNQAYKDSVNVWHPDRFTRNPRLKRKAEEKIKEVNIAYETLKSFYAQGKTPGGRVKSTPFDEDRVKEGAAKTGEAIREVLGRRGTMDETKDKTEAVFEIGTQLVLTAWSHLSSSLRRVVDNQFNLKEKEKMKERKK